MSQSSVVFTLKKCLVIRALDTRLQIDLLENDHDQNKRSFWQPSCWTQFMFVDLRAGAYKRQTISEVSHNTTRAAGVSTTLDDRSTGRTGDGVGGTNNEYCDNGDDVVVHMGEGGSAEKYARLS